MSKLNLFVNKLASTVQLNDAKTVKLAIGDSVSNNRTVTVNQLIRYLKTTGHYTIAYNVQDVYEVVSKRLAAQRSRRNNRSDAYDVNEFLTLLTSIATRGAPSTKRAVSKVILFGFND